MNLSPANEYRGNKSAIWDKQYATGKWDILKSPLEEERFNTLAELTREYHDGKKILEIGCGEGLLVQKISPAYSFFAGIDISPVAVSRAAHLENEKTSFRVSDMDNFVPSQNFDLIIFNESVYYSENPIKTIRKYMHFLNDGGVIATSIFGNSSGISLIQRIEKEFRCLKTQSTVNERGTWHCHLIHGEDKRNFFEHVMRFLRKIKLTQ